MKVKELIKELENYNQDAHIVLWVWDNNIRKSSYQTLELSSMQYNDRAVIVKGNWTNSSYNLADLIPKNQI